MFYQNTEIDIPEKISESEYTKHRGETGQKLRLENYQETNTTMKINSDIHDLAVAGAARALHLQEDTHASIYRIRQGSNFK